VNFLARRCVLVWDDAAGSTRTFVVGEGEAGVLLGRERAAAAPAAAEAQV